jgi:hypothetical protein
MIRDPETRDAYAIVKADKAKARKARKEAARQHIRAIVATKAPGQRQPREKANAYLQALRRVPCAVCGALPSDAAHLRFTNMAVGRRNPGMGMKSHDRFATPLCRAHHTEQHAAGNEAAWWAAHRMDPDALAAATYAAFLAGGDMAAVVQEYRPAGGAERVHTGQLRDEYSSSPRSTKAGA